jgi:PAS domain S-box-containing protein
MTTRQPGRRMRALVLTILCSVACSARGQTVLRVPVIDFPPYEYVDEKGDAVGLNPAVLRELCRRLGREVEFIPSNPRAALRGVQVGRFDMRVMARTSELESDYRFLPTILFNHTLVLLASPQDTPEARSLADLDDRRVAVRSHDMAEIFLRRHPSVRRLTVPDYVTGMRLVEDKHAEFFLGNHNVCLHLINVGAAPALTPVLTNITTTPACVAMSGSSPPAFAGDVAARLAAMEADGTLDRLRTTWLGGRFALPERPQWVGRYLKPLLVAGGIVLGGLLVFVLLLRSMVRQRTRSLVEAQESLRRNEERYRQVFNTAGEAVFIMDQQGYIQTCSDYVYDIFGYRPEELVGRHIRMLAPREKRAEVDEDLAYLSKHGSRVHRVEKMRCTGERIQVELSERVVQWEKDPAIVSFVKDVTDQMRAEDELRQSQDKIAQAQRMEMAAVVAGQIAHDLNNLLTPLLGLPDLIREELPQGSVARKDLDLIEMSAHRMGEISQQLLTLGRRGHYAQKPMDLNKLVRDALSSLAPRIPADVKVEEHLSEGVLPVMGGAAQLLRAMTNMLRNAVEAMLEGGTLRVSTATVMLSESAGDDDGIRPGEYAEITISDEGVGMPPEIREKIFEPFFSTKQIERERGHGLGLSVVHGVVEDHKGHIRLTSSPGKGTTFAVYLPLCHDAKLEETPASTIHGTETLLVVDDDQLQIDVYTRILSSLGYHVSGVRSGEEAVAYVKEHEVDLLVMDVVMEGGIDGTEAYRRIKELNPDQRAIFVSGYVEASLVAAARRLGAGPMLKKPLSKEILARAIRNELDRRVSRKKQAPGG